MEREKGEEKKTILFRNQQLGCQKQGPGNANNNWSPASGDPHGVFLCFYVIDTGSPGGEPAD